LGAVSKRRELPFDPIARARTHWRDRGWGDAAQGMAVVTSIMRAQQVFAAVVDDVLRPLRLTFSRYEVLMLLVFSRRGELPLGKIGERLQVHPASVTNAINRLEAQGLVQRLPHPTDGRTTLAAITPAGREIAETATTVMNREVFTRIGLSAPDADALFDVLRTLRREAGDFA
jgi:DNA-binding MarR family transcriptional regulator